MIAAKLHKKFGEELPVITWRCSERSTKTDKAFYLELNQAFGFPSSVKHGETAFDLKQRLENAIKLDTERTVYRKCVLFVDEAQWLLEREFNWLISLYNELDWDGSRLIVFLVGQKLEMGQMLEKLRKEKSSRSSVVFLHEFLFFIVLQAKKIWHFFCIRSTIILITNLEIITS